VTTHSQHIIAEGSLPKDQIFFPSLHNLIYKYR